MEHSSVYASHWWQIGGTYCLRKRVCKAFTYHVLLWNGIWGVSLLSGAFKARRRLSSLPEKNTLRDLVSSVGGAECMDEHALRKPASVHEALPLLYICCSTCYTFLPLATVYINTVRYCRSLRTTLQQSTELPAVFCNPLESVISDIRDERENPRLPRLSILHSGGKLVDASKQRSFSIASSFHNASLIYSRMWWPDMGNGAM